MRKNKFLIKYFGMLFTLLIIIQSTILTGLNSNNCILLTNIIEDNIIQSSDYYNKNYVITQKSVLYVGGDGENNYSKIQDAINDAKDGDIVFVYSAHQPYYEHIFINSSIMLIGENQQSTIIDGSCFESVINIQSDFVTIRGFTIQKSGYDFFYEWDAGIVCKKTESCEIYDNIIADNYIGIYVSLCNNILIRNNTFFSNNIASDGIICTFSYNISINNNVLGASSNTQRDAIYLSHVTNSLISNNYIFNYQNGLRLLRSHFNTIQKNILHNNQMFGIQMQYSGNNAIQNNIIRGSFFGIIINYVPQSTENYIFYNDFIDNTNHAFFVELNSGITQWRHNFWGDFRIMPKVILGFFRDTMKIQTERARPVVAFDKRPNIKMNNDNLSFIYDLVSIHEVSKFYRFYNLLPMLLFQSDLIISKSLLDSNEIKLKNIKQPDSIKGIHDINMSVGDIIFMDCKRYNPAHSRPTNYSDHVALYIGNDPLTNEKLFVDTVDGFGPRICNLSDFERWAHHFALGRVIHATEKQRIGAVIWAKQLVLERNKPFSKMGDMVFDNYQRLPLDFDLLGCWKTNLLDGIEKYSQFWYCSELVWAAYYNVDENGNLGIFQEYSQRIDLDPSGWNIPFVVTAYEIFINEDDVEIYYKEPIA
jgi:parallel beta-helix repeat protein